MKSSADGRAQQEILRILSKAVDQSSFVLREDPRAFFPLLYNQLWWRTDRNELLTEKLEAERNRYTRPWLRFIFNPHPEPDALLRSFSGHKKKVTSWALSPDGSRLVSGSHDSTLRLWEVKSGKELLAQQGDLFAVRCCAFSPDGRRVVSGGDDKVLKLWDAETGQKLRAFPGHTQLVSACAFSPNGRRLVSASYDTTLKLWDTERGGLLATLQGHKGWVQACAFSPDGRRVVSGGRDWTLRLWDAENGQELASFKEDRGYVDACSISQDKKRVAGISVNCITVWDVENGQVTAKSGKDSGYFLAFNPATGHAVLKKSRSLVFWDWEREKIIASVECLALENVLAFSHDEKRLISASLDHSLKLWDLGGPSAIGYSQERKKPVRLCVFLPNGRRVISIDESAPALWDAERGRMLAARAGTVWSDGIYSLSQDGQRYLFGGVGRMTLVDIESGKTVAEFSRHGDSFGVQACAFSPDSRKAVSGSYDGTLELWDIGNQTVLATLQAHPSGVKACAFSPDGNYVASSDKDGHLTLWNTSGTREAAALTGHSFPVSLLTFSPDGKRLVSGGGDKFLKMWDVPSGQEIFHLNGHAKTVKTCSFSPDGRRLVSGSMDTTIRVWDGESGRELITLNGHGGPVNICAFSPDGKRIASGSDDGSVVLWELETGEELTKLRGHFGRITTCAFSPDGRRLVAGGQTGAVLFLFTENILVHSCLVTPLRRSESLYVHCPLCGKTDQTEGGSLGREVRCSGCGNRLRLNPFFLDRE